jgi:branched-chain amino acid transport system substrate-binding protein
MEIDVMSGRTNQMNRFGTALLVGATIYAVAAAIPARAEVKVGFHAPLTGFAAADGKSANVAAQLAVEDINATGGLAGERVVLVPYDDQAQPAQSIAIANKLIAQDGVSFAVSGSYSEPTRAAATVFQEGSIPYIAAYATHPAITAAGPYVFRPFKIGPPQGAAAARFIVEDLKLKRVSIVTVDNDHGQTALSGFKPAAEKLGLEIIGAYTFGMKDRQFGPIVASVKRDNPDVIYVAGYFFHGAPLAIQLRAAGVTAPIVGTQGFESQELISIAGAAANGIYVINGMNRDNPDPKYKSFMTRLTERGGAEAPGVASAVYSAFMLLQDAAKRAGSIDRTQVREALAATTNFPHFYGTLQAFNADRDGQLPTPVIMAKDGKFVFVANIAN